MGGDFNMAGRPSKPTEIIEAEGKTHLTKAEIEHRKQAEKSLYTGENFTESKQVKQNKIAHTEFLRLRRLYNKITYVDALDQQIVNRYCLEISNQEKLQQILEKMELKIDDCEQLETKDIIQLYKSINGVLSNINKSKSLLLQYEDRLFLNPTSRIKSVPKKPEKPEKKSRLKSFMDNRNAN